MASKVGLGVLVVAAVGAGLYSSGFTVEDAVEMWQGTMEWFELNLKELGPVRGPLMVFLIYLMSTVFMLPLWGFHTIIGYVYGTVPCGLLVTTIQSLSAGAAFLVSRNIVGPYVRPFIERKYGKKFTAIDKAISEDGFKITLLIRLSPILPFGVNNYMSGLSTMKVSHFVAATWLGVLPGTSAYCNVGSLGKNALAEGATMFQKGLMFVGVLAALAVIKIMSDKAAQALKEAGIGDEDENNKDKKNE